MKKVFLSFIIGCIIPVSLYAYTSPGRPAGYVTDFAGVLSVHERQDIESKLSMLRRDTGVEIAVVTVPSLDGDSVEHYALQLFEEWGIGNKEKDTGILVLVAIDDRAVRIETGYGSESLVTDLESGEIIRSQMIPAFTESHYAQGISNGVSALISTITGAPFVSSAADTSSQWTGSQNVDDNRVFILALALLVVIGRILARTGSWWFGGVLGAAGGIIIGFIWGFVYTGILSIVGLAVFGLLFDFIVSRRPPGSGGIFFGGFGSGWGSGSGGFGGGFGGFGGGSSGGGGASGRW